MDQTLNNLYGAILSAKQLCPDQSRTAELFQKGIKKITKKLSEEATEVCLEAILDKRNGVISESADLLYNLCVLWVALDVTPQDVASELDRRADLMGIAEKLPKQRKSDTTS